MPSIRISKELTSGIYYFTFTVKNWYYILDRHNRFQILADALKYSHRHREIRIHAYVFLYKDALHTYKPGSQAICEKTGRLDMVIRQSGE